MPPPGFSRAERRTRSRISSLIGGRPFWRGWVQWRRSSRRCQASRVAGVTSLWARTAVGSSWASADRTARSGQDNRGRPFSCRLSTATSWRSARTSASTAVSLRTSRPRPPTTRIIIRYTSRSNTPSIVTVDRKIQLTVCATRSGTVQANPCAARTRDGRSCNDQVRLQGGTGPQCPGEPRWKNSVTPPAGRILMSVHTSRRRRTGAGRAIAGRDVPGQARPVVTMPASTAGPPATCCRRPTTWWCPTGWVRRCWPGIRCRPRCGCSGPES